MSPGCIITKYRNPHQQAPDAQIQTTQQKSIMPPNAAGKEGRSKWTPNVVTHNQRTSLSSSSFATTSHCTYSGCNITAPKRQRQTDAIEEPTARLARKEPALTRPDIKVPPEHHEGMTPHQHKLVQVASDSLLDTIMADTGPLALHTADKQSLAKRITRMYTLMTFARAESTQRQDTGKTWTYWLRWCKLHKTPPVRNYFDSRATALEAATENYLWTAALPWIYGVMPAGAGRTVPKPSSAVNVLRGVRRVQVALGYQPPALTSLNLALKGLMREVVDEHGPEVLEVKRTVPIPFATQCELVRLMRSSNSRLGSRVTNGATCLFWCSLIALTATLGSSGMRKAEVTSKTKKLQKTDLLRSNLTWIINDVHESDPTKEQLMSMCPGSSWAILKPCPSKSDPFGMVWGTKPIYLSYCPSREINAASSLLQLELMWPSNGNDRREMPLFCDNDRTPLTGAAMDKLLRMMLTAIKQTTLYSWHSFRAALACQLLDAHASTADIMSLCRWQSEESLAGYAQHSAQAYTTLLDAAYARDFTQVRYSQTPVAIEHEMLRNMSGLHIAV